MSRTHAVAGRTLRYDSPATDWEREALPVGNGALGAMVFGGVARERLQLNEKSLWTGGPGSKEGYAHGNWPGPRPDAIAEVRRIIDETGAMDPEDVARRLGNPAYANTDGIPGFGNYQNFGELVLDVPDAPSSPVGYRRCLDTAEALATVTYQHGHGDRDRDRDGGGVRFLREYFASHPAQVVAGRLTADRPGRISFTLGFAAAQEGAVVTAEGGRLLIRGVLADNGLVYEGQVRVLHHGGTRTEDEGRITVTGADSATFVFSAGTDYADSYPDYRGADPHARVTELVDRAARQPYEELRAAHIRDHSALFDRVVLDIGGRMPDLPTDRLLASYTGGDSPADRALESLYFGYGRYLLIASSRPGSLPANLQGVWNNSNTPPWCGDYHTNINVQMNYWPAEPTHLAETAEPYHRFVEQLREPGRGTAAAMFGTEGWVVHQNTNAFGFTGVHDWPTSFWMPEANGWLAQQLYEHFLFHRDEDFLRLRAYPAMKEAARFWLANLHTDPRDSSLVVSPSYSPEQGDFTAGASICQQIVYDLLTNTLDAAEVLGEESEFRAELTAALASMDPGLRIGSWGQLQEWKADLDDPSDTHRHASHLFALHPGRQIERGSPFAEAARVSLGARGDGGTGWSKAWKINFWARLGDGDHAGKMLAEQLRSSTLPNLWDTHPPFQIDGNFGATAGIAEMLLQSHSRTGVVDVLPALPRRWAGKGSYEGLRARGDFTVGVAWRRGAATEIRVVSGSGVTAKLRSPLFEGPFRVERSGGRRGGQPGDHVVRDGVLVLPTVAGEEYRITAVTA